MSKLISFDEPFNEWLHELTLLGYDQDIMIPARHADRIKSYYEEKLTPDEALQAYMNDRLSME
jgi:hypothetical protein